MGNSNVLYIFLKYWSMEVEGGVSSIYKSSSSQEVSVTVMASFYFWAFKLGVLRWILDITVLKKNYYTLLICTLGRKQLYPNERLIYVLHHYTVQVTAEIDVIVTNKKYNIVTP